MCNPETRKLVSLSLSLFLDVDDQSPFIGRCKVSLYIDVLVGVSENTGIYRDVRLFLAVGISLCNVVNFLSPPFEARFGASEA